MAGSLDFYANLDPNSVANHAFGSGAEILGSNGGYSYSRVAKADGGYDYYRGYQRDNNTAPDIRPISEADAFSGMGGIAQNNEAVSPSPDLDGGTTGITAAERAYYQSQIDQLNGLLGLTNTQLQTGLEKIGVQKERLEGQNKRAMEGYDEQTVENAQGKQKGFEGVDSFAQNSLSSLQRLLQGANAGSSSVGRSLVPYLISKGAGTRRQGVIDTAGRNLRDIDSARIEATDNYNLSKEDLGLSEQDFRSGIGNKRLDILGQIKGMEYQRDNGTSPAAQGTQSRISDQFAELNSLFGQFNPTYKPYQTKAPELGSYQIDPAKIEQNSNVPGEARYYMPMLKKKLGQPTV